jgi:hypothetical protein
MGPARLQQSNGVDVMAKKQTLTVLWPGDINLSNATASGTKEDPVVFRVDNETEPEFTCGNCGVVLVVGDPLNAARYFIAKSVMIECSICGARHDPDQLNGSVAGRRLVTS